MMAYRGLGFVHNLYCLYNRTSGKLAIGGLGLSRRFDADS